MVGNFPNDTGGKGHGVTERELLALMASNLYRTEGGFSHELVILAVDRAESILRRVDARLGSDSLKSPAMNNSQAGRAVLQVRNLRVCYRSGSTDLVRR